MTVLLVRMIKKHRRMPQLNKNSQMLATKLQKLKLRRLRHKSLSSTILYTCINVILCNKVSAVRPFQSLVQHMPLGSRRVEHTSVTTIKHTYQLPLHMRTFATHYCVNIIVTQFMCCLTIYLLLLLSFILHNQNNKLGLSAVQSICLTAVFMIFTYELLSFFSAYIASICVRQLVTYT